MLLTILLLNLVKEYELDKRMSGVVEIWDTDCDYMVEKVCTSQLVQVAIVWRNEGMARPGK